jgi:hypothetical protein
LIQFYLCINILDVELFIDVRLGQVVFDSQGLVSNLNRQSIFQVKETRLTNIFQTGTRLTNFRLLETHSGARTPSEDGKGPVANFALFAKPLLCLQTKIKRKIYIKQNEKFLEEN